MRWNYRVIESDSAWRAIHEVYYDDSGSPSLYSEEPCGIGWERGEDPEVIMKQMASALDKPVLTRQGFEGGG